MCIYYANLMWNPSPTITYDYRMNLKGGGGCQFPKTTINFIWGDVMIGCLMFSSDFLVPSLTFSIKIYVKTNTDNYQLSPFSDYLHYYCTYDNSLKLDVEWCYSLYANLPTFLSIGITVYVKSVSNKETNGHSGKRFILHKFLVTKKYEK